MTEDEQEALSIRYICPRIVRLSSGNIAIMDMSAESRPPIIIEYDDICRLLESIPQAETLCSAHDARNAAERKPVARKATLNLADLGL